jgi:Na+/melibiose symporter-like transporter
VIGVLIGSILSGLLFSSIGPLAMGAAVGVIAVVTFYLTLLGLRETDRPVGEPMKAIEGLKATFQNKQFLIIFFSTLFVHMACMMVQANFPYFVTLVLGGSEGDVSLYLGGLILLMALTGPIWSLLNKNSPSGRCSTLPCSAWRFHLVSDFSSGEYLACPSLSRRSSSCCWSG